MQNMETMWIIFFTLWTVLAVAVFLAPILRWRGIPDFFARPRAPDRERELMALRDVHLDFEQGKLTSAEFNEESRMIQANTGRPEDGASASRATGCPACGYGGKDFHVGQYCPRCGSLP